MPQVILVDQNDQEIGVMEKLEAHQKAELHRAISVFLFNSKGEMLIQRRALSKYHSPGLWSNTCCTHPEPGESNIEACHRRLREEMGMDAEMYKLFSFIYKVEFSNGLTEHELDHVFVGQTDSFPDLNPEEVCDWRYVNIKDLGRSMQLDSEHYTEWFKIIYKKLEGHLDFPKA